MEPLRSHGRRRPQCLGTLAPPAPRPPRRSQPRSLFDISLLEAIRQSPNSLNARPHFEAAARPFRSRGRASPANLGLASAIPARAPEILDQLRQRLEPSPALQAGLEPSPYELRSSSPSRAFHSPAYAEERWTDTMPLLFLFYLVLLPSLGQSRLFGVPPPPPARRRAGLLILLAAWKLGGIYEPERRRQLHPFLRPQGTALVSFTGLAALLGALAFCAMQNLPLSPESLLLLTPILLGFTPLTLGLGHPVPSGAEPPPPRLVEPPPPGAPGLRELRFSWTFESVPYQTTLPIRLAEYEAARNRPRVLDHTVWAREYVAEGILPEIRHLAATLARLGPGFGSYAEVCFVLAFVQQIITYEKDEGEYPKYPLETLTEAAGDCEDFAILAAALLHAMDYQTALPLSPATALGIAGATGVPGIHATHDGLDYYYCEMTGTHWLIGELPRIPTSTDAGLTVPYLPRRVVQAGEEA